MGQSDSKEFVQPVLTLSGLVSLNLPCIASKSPSDSTLGSLQRFGFPFNMNKKTLDRHFSFSTKNLMKGRYHTCVTCLFNHTGVDHFNGNMVMLINSGYSVHKLYGRKHMLTAFIGGGVSGCAAQFFLYLYQKVKWENILPLPKTWKFLGDSLVSHLHQWQRKALSNIFTHVNAWRPCIGCSAAVSSLMAVQACHNIVSIADKLRQPIQSLDVDVIYQLSQLLFTALVIYEDISMLLGSTVVKDKGFLGSVVAYSIDGVGHAAHVGGFIFGILYFAFFLYKRNSRQS